MTMTTGGRKHNATGRTTGQRKQGGKYSIPGQFAWRLIEMLESPAYRSLSLTAHRILARLEIELGRHGGADNGRLPCTFDDFVRYGIDRHAIAPAVRELIALGFIECEFGVAGNGDFRRPNMFRLTYRPCGAMDPTDEWRATDTAPAAKSAARSARKKNSKPKLQNQKTSGGLSPEPMGETHTAS